MKESNWIDWEIEYSLKQISRQGRTFHINGVVGVIMKVDGSYDWFVRPATNCHGSPVVTYASDSVYPIISKNHFNSDPPQWHCEECKTYDWLSGSYIEYVKEDDFLANPGKYIDDAYDKSENDGVGFCLCRSRNT